MAQCQDRLNALLPTDQKPQSAYTKAIRKLLPTGVIWGFITNQLSGILNDNVTNTNNSVPYNDNPTGVATDTNDNTPDTVDSKITSTVFGNLISTFGSELYRFQAAWYNLYTQSIPGLSTDLLEDWERNAGLPDSCTIDPNTISLEERQCIVHEKIYALHQLGMSKPFYIAYAESFGYSISITEAGSNSVPFTAAPTGLNPLDSGSRVGTRLSGAPPVYTTFTITTGPTDPNQIARLQCNIDKYQPAHTQIVWIVNI